MVFQLRPSELDLTWPIEYVRIAVCGSKEWQNRVALLHTDRTQVHVLSRHAHLKVDRSNRTYTFFDEFLHTVRRFTKLTLQAQVCCQEMDEVAQQIGRFTPKLGLC